MHSLTELIAVKMQWFFVFCKHLTSGFLEANRFSGPMTSLNMFYQVCFDLPSWHFFPDKNELSTKKIAVRFDFSTRHLITFPLFHWLLITAPGQNWKQKNNKILLQQPIMANTCRLAFERNISLPRYDIFIFPFPRHNSMNWYNTLHISHKMKWHLHHTHIL